LRTGAEILEGGGPGTAGPVRKKGGKEKTAAEAEWKKGVGEGGFHTQAGGTFSTRVKGTSSNS